MKTEYYFLIFLVLFITLVIFVIRVLAAEKRALEWRKMQKALKIQSLIDKFENDIIFRRGSMEGRIERSKAREELVRQGRAALGEIVNHLERVRFSPDGEMAYVWRHLFEEMQTVHKLSGTVEHYMLLDSWIEWAKGHIEATSA
jgi:hypothetical protein